MRCRFYGCCWFRCRARSCCHHRFSTSYFERITNHQFKLPSIESTDWFNRWNSSDISIIILFLFFILRLIDRWYSKYDPFSLFTLSARIDATVGIGRPVTGVDFCVPVETWRAGEFGIGTEDTLTIGTASATGHERATITTLWYYHCCYCCYWCHLLGCTHRCGRCCRWHTGRSW